MSFFEAHPDALHLRKGDVILSPLVFLSREVIGHKIVDRLSVLRIGVVRERERERDEEGEQSFLADESREDSLR